MVFMATYRIGITFDEEQNKRFLALAEFYKKKPATLANEIIKAHMKACAPDIDSILQARADYEKKVDELREKNFGASLDDPGFRGGK
ncbi:MAG: hypothetical protein IJP68_05040 [Selenomonadaceae bacterium]|nr:hypothetical protein [Selenomonadaceae bacterium]